MNTRARAAGPGNPFLNGIVMEETLLRTETAAQRSMNMQAARTWQVLNTSERSTLGYHPGYIIVPGGNSLPYVAPASQVRRRAGFVNNHFWATRYHEDELSAAGTYPNQSSVATVSSLGRQQRVAGRARTSSSGTRSASRTFHAPRSGR